MVVYPPIAGLLGLDARGAALFLGGSIHDVAQVVGAAFTISPEVGDGATLVKLLRVALLVPVVLLMSRVARGDAESAEGSSRRRAGLAARLPLPGFLVAFVALALLNSAGLVSPTLAGWLGDVSRWCLATAIAALGVRTSLGQLASLGWAPIAMIAGETAFIAAVVLAGVALL
jgi:uncharacterized membrane protein YadS